MKIRYLLLCVLMAALCGCSASVDSPPQPGEPLDISAFSFIHSGSSTSECYHYSAEKAEGGTHLYIEGLFSGGLIIDKVIDEPVLEQLGEIAGKYRIDKWNGFDKSKKNVADGSSFTLSVTLTKGSTISAHGNNAFPDGYSDAKSVINALFEALISQYATEEKEGQ